MVVRIPALLILRLLGALASLTILSLLSPLLRAIFRPALGNGRRSPPRTAEEWASGGAAEQGIGGPGVSSEQEDVANAATQKNPGAFLVRLERQIEHLEAAGRSASVLKARVSRLEAAATASAIAGLSLAHSVERRIIRLEEDELRMPEPEVWYGTLAAIHHEWFRSAEKSRTSSVGSSCALTALGDFSSRETMIGAGWELGLDDMMFLGRGFIGWGGGHSLGTLATTLRAPGRIFVSVRNHHVADSEDNVVSAYLNNEVVLKLRSTEELEICLGVRAGDVFRLAENFGQIEINGFRAFCDSQGTGSGVGRGGHSVEPRRTGVHCSVGQHVYVPAGRCGEPLWEQGEVEAVLNQSRAVVRLDSGISGEANLLGRPSRWRISLADQLSMTPSSSSPRCMDFMFSRARVGIIVLVDDQPLGEKQTASVHSLRSYAASRGYDHEVLDGARYHECLQFEDFSFRRHCVVAEFLKERPLGYAAAVVSTDVVAVVLERGLEAWLATESDIHFYESEREPEVSAFGYIARATPWTRGFLRRWAELSSFGLGHHPDTQTALQSLIIESLQLRNSESCLSERSSVDLAQRRKFSECARALIGPPRSWRGIAGITPEEKRGSLTIWPRLHFFVAEGSALGEAASSYAGPVMLRNIQTRITSLVTREELGQIALRHARESPELFPQGGDCRQCVERCMPHLTCAPLLNSEEPRPRRVCTVAECEM